jgi:hypothetical protein
MSAIASIPASAPAASAERVAWPRLAWVAPLTLIVAVAVCYGLQTLYVTLDPSLSRMGQLGRPMFTLASEGSVAAILVFAVFALVVPRPIFWYRVVGLIAMVLSWAPDIALGLGGQPMLFALRAVGPLASIGLRGGPPAGGGAPPGGQAGGPPPGFLSGMPWEHVLVLMSLHAAVALVCIGMLTTLARARRPVGKLAA